GFGFEGLKKVRRVPGAPAAIAAWCLAIHRSASALLRRQVIVISDPAPGRVTSISKTPSSRAMIVYTAPACGCGWTMARHMPAKRGGGRFDSRPGRAQAHALGGPGPLHPSRISPSYRTAYVHGRPHEAGERCGACRRQGEADEQAL